jgi:gluconate 2-dehydrogenase alpha chain
MAKQFQEVDVVIIGLGWTGGILAKELSQAGLKVVALERGAYRTPEEAFTVPHIRDELEYSSRTGLMIDTKTDTLTIRNNPAQTALPMRRLGSFLPGTGVGGAGSHWNGHTWRWTDSDLRVRPCTKRSTARTTSRGHEHPGLGHHLQGTRLYYDHFEKIAGISAPPAS